jgi:branched-chain amino acid transport system substrate-binding protein
MTSEGVWEKGLRISNNTTKKEGEQMDRKKIFVIISLGFLLVSLHAISAGASESKVAVDKWKIPLLMLMSGPHAAAGKEVTWATQYAVDKINAAGGIRGKPVELEVHDTALDPARALTAARDVASWALVIVGPATSVETKSAAPVAVQNKVAMLACGTQTMSMLEDNAPYLFTFRIDPQWGANVATKKWMDLNPGLKTFVMFQETKVVGYTSQAKALASAFVSNGAKQIGKQTFETGDISFGPQVTQARARRPDFYLVVGNSADIARVIVALRKQGVKEPVFTGLDFESEETYEIGGQALEGAAWFSEIYNQLATPEWNAFKKAHHEALKKEVVFQGDPLFYDSMYVIKDAFEKQNITGDPSKLHEERAKILDYLHNIKDFKGVTANFSIVPRGEAMRTIYLLQLKNLQPVLIEAIEPR